jgi:aromatic-L-amino-acid decarboxylase
MKDNKLNPTLSMTAEEMKAYGYKIVDLLVEHVEELPNKKPVAIATRHEMDGLLEEEFSEDSTPANEVVDVVMENVLSNCDLLTHPKFYSYCPSPSNFISTMADTLATGFNIFSGAWITSPGATDLEIICINWLLKIFGLPVKDGGGFFTSGGSMANMTGVVTARNVKCGDNTSNAVLYMSAQAHSSNSKAAKIVGLREDQVRVIPTENDFTINIEALSMAIKEDKKEGRFPFCVVATAGTTNTGSVDDLSLIADLCDEEQLWMHVDGAYGGAAILSRNANKLKGIERANSIAVDPHKWFFQPYEIGCVLIRKHEWLSSTFSVSPEYLRDMKGDAGEVNFSDQGIQLTRRFRALKFYMSLKTFGLASFRAAINSGIDLAETTESLLNKNPNWEIISHAELAVINYRYNPINKDLSAERLDELNQFISKQLIISREAMLTTTRLNDKTVLRMCLINPRTTIYDVQDSVQRLEGFAEVFLNEGV